LRPEARGEANGKADELENYTTKKKEWRTLEKEKNIGISQRRRKIYGDCGGKSVKDREKVFW